MTKIPVNVPNFASNMMYSTAKVQETDAKGEFGKIFESQKSAEADVKTQEIGNEESVTEPESEAVEETDQNEPVSEVNETQESDSVEQAGEAQQTEQSTDNDSTEGELSEEEMNLVMPLLQEAIVDIQDMLAQELGISQEELSALMEDMGISEMDLLNQGTLKDLLLQAKGIEDMTMLLTDEELYMQIQNVEGSFEEIMSNVQDTLQMTDEEMTALKEQLTNMVNTNGPTVSVETDVVDAVTQKGQTNNEEATPQENPFATPNQNLTNVQNAATQNDVMQANASFASAETENIMNQIMDYMKIQLSAETDVLEMQLQPESLGTLQIRISAKEGIMTAQFTTASETVKAALESQMVQLQQQFENQNIKVDAIEVMVQTHQFESALEQGGERQQTEEGKKNKSRSIDLSRLEEVNDMPEEDRIVAEMMAANGNTVDYLA